VRIGTAEVYRFAETAEAVEDSLVIGDQIKKGKRAGDVRIVLFVKLKEGVELDAEIEADIRLACKTGGSDAHVPALIRQVQTIPYTRSGKKVEVAVRDLVAGSEPKNVGALQDPTAFDEYRAMAADSTRDGDPRLGSMLRHRKQRRRFVEPCTMSILSEMYIIQFLFFIRLRAGGGPRSHGQCSTDHRARARS